MRNSMRSVGNVVRTMPDNLLNTVDEVMDNITKVFVNEDNPQVNFDSTGAIDLEVEIFQVPPTLFVKKLNPVTPLCLGWLIIEIKLLYRLPALVDEQGDECFNSM